MMSRYFPLILFLAAAAACSPTDNAKDPSGQNAPAAPPAGASLTGQNVYNGVCAACHDDGLGGAPAVGDREAWAGRSSMWVAVLEEHAKEGYLGMPARGGDPALTDREVAAAVEYMLTLIHPDRATD
jgi:cytochrome c5